MAEQVFYEIARWRLDEQLDQIRELNSRLTGAFTGATALLVLFGVLQDLGPVSSSGTAIGLASAAVGVYVALLLTALVGYRIDLVGGPALSGLGTFEQTEDDARRSVTITILESVAANEPLVQRKSQIVFATLTLWALDALLLLATSLTATN